MSFYKSLAGQYLGIGATGNLKSRVAGTDIDLSQPCVDASITVSAEAATTADTRDITIQLKDAKGNPIDYVETVMVALFTTAARTAFVTTGGSTGIGIGANGALLALVAKKVYLLTSEDDGAIDLEWLDTGSEAAFLALYLPNGRVVMSTALANT